MRQLTSLDAQFLALESARQTGHVGGLAILDPDTAPGKKIDGADIQRLLEERLPALPPFHWKLAEVPLGLDFPYWIDDPDFDLNFHVREIALPPPGSDNQLSEQVSRIMARPLDRSRPLWELYLIHGLELGFSAVLTKIPHAVIDGMSGAEIMGLLLDLSPEGRPPPDPVTVPDVEEGQPGQIQMLARGLLGVPRYPVRLLRSLPTTIPNVDEVPAIFGGIPGAGTVGRIAGRVQGLVTDGANRGRNTLQAPKTKFNGRISPHRRFAFGQLPLDEVKAVKKKHGVTVNDVIVSICAGAVRRWLERHDDLPDEPLVAQIPVSV